MIERSRTYRFSLRARATTWYVGLLAVALIVFSIGIYAGIRTYLKQTLQRELAGTANSIVSDLLTRMPSKGEAWVLGEVRESYAASANDHFVRLSVGSHVLYQTADMRDPTIALTQLALPRIESAGAFHRQHPHGEAVMIYAVPYQAADGRHFEVEAGTSLSRMEQTLHWLAKVLLAATVVILILAAIGGYFLMEQPLRPLATLTEKAADIGRKGLGERLPVIPTGDELERLTHSLNGMIDRLEQALAHNYRFSADASHELRTPLTILRGELEEMLRTEDLPPSVLDNLVSTLEEIDRMSRIVNSLMAITRLDSGGERIDRQTIDLSALVQQTTDHMHLLADEKGLPLVFSCEPNVYVDADPMRLKQVIVNLVDNAIKYTPAEAMSLDEMGEPGVTIAGFVDRKASIRGAVRVTVSASGTSAQLEVADQGIGIAPDVLPYVFDRFYRADFARSRGAGGVGLGLAIVKSIIVAHDGTVCIKSTEGQGSTVTVSLPLVREVGMASRSADPAEKKQPRFQSV